MSEQTNLFLMTIALGAAAGILYDMFRVLRLTFKHPNFLVQIEDMLYWVIATIGVFYFFLHEHGGNMRFFVIVGIVLGMMVYFLAMSAAIRKAMIKLVDWTKKTITVVAAVVLLPVRATLYVLSIPLGIVLRCAKWLAKPAKKHLQSVKVYAKIRKQKLRRELHAIKNRGESRSMETKEKKKARANKQSKKKRKKIGRLFLFFWMLIFLATGTAAYIQLGYYEDYRTQVMQMRRLVEEEQQRHDALLWDRNYYESDAFIERIAREHLNLIRPDEILFFHEYEY